ncbi:hypothetical protein AJ79_00060 [Helicocarpus griseus UAMH5409]|uniref:AttH domain-containing protein n=1 Tax=Helicocarpus griseus UAMH5409 TaxID=1447875 RepID=A0A2B7YBW5_9EURO|nr:hypothetical protein AJ79_00060 [Helicocarpus griseus UAMH5409]
MLPTILLALVSPVSIAANSIATENTDHWFGDWNQQKIIGVSSEASDSSCTVSRVGAHDIAKGKTPVHFSDSPLDNLEIPRIVPSNETGADQWEFDGVSEDGKQGFTFGFYRDPNYAILGSGNLRMYVEFSFADGTRWAQVDYASESTVEHCPGVGSRGVWSGDGYSYTWEISDDFKQSRITFDTPKGKGTVVLKSVAPPRYADGNVWKTDDASLLTVRHFYHTQPIPVADITVDAVIEGKKVEWAGIGGHERLWAAFNWFTCLASMTFIRAKTGPYALTLLEFGSWLDKSEIVGSVFLAEDGEKIFSSRRTEPSETEDYFEYRKVYGGDGVTGNLHDKATGFELDLVSPSRSKQWSFFITHKNVAFEYFLGEGKGGTAYTSTAVGGWIGASQWKGVALTEILKFPERSMVIKRRYID